MGRIKNKIIRTIYKKEEITRLPVRLVSEKMGCDRGTPIDRYYIENFLSANQTDIRGSVMEIGGRLYTKKYGTDVKHSYVFTADKKKKNAIVGDLTTGEGCQENILDCFILTQTLPFMYDIHSAAQNIVKMLKKNGVALVTVGGISMISKYDEARWGHYWGFTKQSLQLLFHPYVDEKNIMIMSYGNAKTAVAFLYGLCQQDLCREDFLYNDELVPVVLCAKIVK